MKNYQVFFLSHGGGPMPLLGDSAHYEMVDCLKDISDQLNKPSAILVISAHWEESITTITAGNNPPLIYDYDGFPEESYRIEYPCSGQPDLAERIHRNLNSAGIEATLNENRGFDHGVFVPLKIMFPDADIPCVQLSLLGNLNPDQHIQIGESLRDLDWENLLIIGSGFSFHNMKQFFVPETIDSRLKNELFDSWLVETCSSSRIAEKDRRLRLVNWELAPAARFCHPREEHLLPLHVCYGIAQAKCKQYFHLKILNKKSSMYLW